MAEVKKNVSEGIAKEPQALTQLLVVTDLIHHKPWRFPR